MNFVVFFFRPPFFFSRLGSRTRARSSTIGHQFDDSGCIWTIAESDERGRSSCEDDVRARLVDLQRLEESRCRCHVGAV